MLNKSIIMGRLTADPELHHTQSNVAVTSFCLAVDRDFKPTNGERETDFIDVVAWRNTAEFICKYFSKGQMAIAVGSTQTRKYTDNDGKNRKAVEIIADNVYFADSKRDSDNNGDDDLPFQSDSNNFENSDAKTFYPDFN